MREQKRETMGEIYTATELKGKYGPEDQHGPCVERRLFDSSLSFGLKRYHIAVLVFFIFRHLFSCLKESDRCERTGERVDRRRGRIMTLNCLF